MDCRILQLDDNAAGLLVQVIGFGVVAGVCSGVYHRIRSMKGQPKLPERQQIFRGLAVVYVLIAVMGSWSEATRANPDWTVQLMTFGLIYAVLRVIGTTLVFRGVRNAIAGGMDHVAPAHALQSIAPRQRQEPRIGL